MTRLLPLLVLALVSCSKKAAAPTAGSGSDTGASAGSTVGSATTAAGSAATAAGSGSAGSAAGSGSSEPPVGSDAPVQAGSAGSGSAGSGAPASRSSVAVVAGTSCETHGTQITKAGATTFKLSGTTLRGEHAHGCGCPSGPVHTVVYKVASPLEVRICFDQTKDNCEMACQDVTFDLAKPLAEAKATSVKFVD